MAHSPPSLHSYRLTRARRLPCGHEFDQHSASPQQPLGLLALQAADVSLRCCGRDGGGGRPARCGGGASKPHSPSHPAPSLIQSLLPRAHGQALGYGGALRKRFGLEEAYTQLNHGPFGVCPPDVNNTRKALLDHVETNPDAWIGHHGPEKSYRPLMNEAKELIAKELHIPAVNDIVLVENASSGINAVMRSFPWRAGDKVLYLNCAYGMVQNVLGYLAKTHGVELVVVEMESTGFASPGAVIDAVAAVVKAHGGPSAFRAAVISHITSVPAVILPVREFCDLLGPGVPVVCDGAHALGQLDVDVPALGCAACESYVCLCG